MKKLCWVFLIALNSQNAISQEQNIQSEQLSEKKIKELFLTGNGMLFQNPSITYKKKLKSKNRFLKLGLTNLNYQNQKDLDDVDVRNYNYSAGIIIGIEKRKEISGKLLYYHGLNLALNYANQVNSSESGSGDFYRKSKNQTSNYTLRIPYTFGLLYNIKPWIGLGVELNPSVYTNIRSNSNYNAFGQDDITQTEVTDSTIGFSFSSGLRLSLAVRLSEL